MSGKLKDQHHNLDQLNNATTPDEISEFTKACCLLYENEEYEKSLHDAENRLSQANQAKSKIESEYEHLISLRQAKKRLAEINHQTVEVVYNRAANIIQSTFFRNKLNKDASKILAKQPEIRNNKLKFIEQREELYKEREALLSELTKIEELHKKQEEIIGSYGKRVGKVA